MRQTVFTDRFDTPATEILFCHMFAQCSKTSAHLLII